MAEMNTAIFTIIAVLPSIIWLLFYLRKDKHPEPNKMVVKVFSWGILITLAVLVLELLYVNALQRFSLQNVGILLIGGWAFIEEYFKYFVVKTKVLRSPEFDEPTDAMLYMIIAALGFAAGENILLLNNLYILGTPLNQMLGLTSGRLVSAVFLHTLSSGIVGYFLARSLLLKKERKSFVGIGIIIATCLHGFYNYIIMKIGSPNDKLIFLLVAFLISLAIIVSLAFKKLNKIKSICNI